MDENKKNSRVDRLLIVAFACSVGACSAGGNPQDAGPLLVLTDAACNGAIVRNPEQDSPHQEPGSVVNFRDNPPTNGPHYGVWARWGIYREVLARGYWVHNLEHGGIVLAYRPDATAAQRDALEAFAMGLPPEPGCLMEGVRRRIIVTPDPLLTAPFAAMAWSHSYRADCIDTATLERFVLTLTGRAPENICANGGFEGTPGDGGVVGDASVAVDASTADAVGGGG